MLLAITVIEPPTRAFSLRDAIVIGKCRSTIFLAQVQSHTRLGKQCLNQMSCEGGCDRCKDREEKGIALTILSGNAMDSDPAPASSWELCSEPNRRLFPPEEELTSRPTSLLVCMTPRPSEANLKHTSSSPCSWGHTKCLPCPWLEHLMLNHVCIFAHKLSVQRAFLPTPSVSPMSEGLFSLKPQPKYYDWLPSVIQCLLLFVKSSTSQVRIIRLSHCISGS